MFPCCYSLTRVFKGLKSTSLENEGPSWKVLKNIICMEKFLETGQMSWKSTWIRLFYICIVLKKISRQRSGYLDKKKHLGAFFTVWWQLLFFFSWICILWIFHATMRLFLKPIHVVSRYFSFTQIYNYVFSVLKTKYI